jgi:hypothetical protein
MDVIQAQEIIEQALTLARERVTGELNEKEARRERLSDLIARMNFPEVRPTAEDLTEALGDPDRKVLREAIAVWQAEAPAGSDAE